MDRNEHIAALRELLDVLENDPELPMPSGFGRSEYSEVYVYIPSMDNNWNPVDQAIQRQQLAECVKKLTTGIAKKEDASSILRVAGKFGPLRILIIANRDAVCTRKVTGTKEITEVVPDPSVKVPMVEQTRVIEEVEWVCEPLLKGQ